MSHQLRIIAGPASGKTVPVQAGYTYSVGRAPEAQLSIPEDQTLSRNHAQVYFDGSSNQWLIKNESQHGTLFNGEVFNDYRYLPEGSQFQVGGSTVILEAYGATGGPAAAAPTAAAAAAPGAAAAAGGAPGYAGAPAAAAVGGAAPAAPGAAAPAAYAGAPGAVAAAPGQPGAVAAPGQPGAVAAPGQPGAVAAPGQPAAAGAPAGGGMAMPGMPGGAGGAMAALPSGPVKIEHQGEGFPYGALIKGGLGVFKSNFIASVIVAAPLGVLAVMSSFSVVLAKFELTAILGLWGMLTGVVALVGFLAMPLLMWNYLMGVRNFQKTGESIGIGDMLKFDNLPRKYICSVCAWLGSIPIGLASWSYHLYQERETTEFVPGLKAAWGFSMKNLVPVIILVVVFGVVAFMGNLLAGILGAILGKIPAIGWILGLVCGLLGGAITMLLYPSMAAAHYLAYTVKQSEIEAAAAEAGITL